MDDTELVDLEVNLTGFGLLNGLANFHSNSAGFGVRHQATRTKDTAEGTHFRHDTGHGNDNIYIRPTAFYFGDVLIETIIIGSGSFGFLLLVGGAEHQHADHLAGTVRQRHTATHHLVGLTRVNTQTDVDIKTGVEFGVGNLFYHLHGLFERIDLVLVELGESLFLFFR